MKTRLTLIAFLLVLVAPLSAQENAPTALAGKTAVVVISSGTGPFAPVGGYRINFSTSTYTVSPLAPTVIPSAGIYVYSKTGPNTGRITITDASVGVAVAQTLIFSGPATASYNIAALGGTQSGTLVLEGLSAPASTTSSDKIINISVRAVVPSGSQVIPGFVLEAPARVLVRVGGPALAALGVSGTLANPRFTLFSGSTAVGSNDDWTSTIANQTAVLDAASRSGAFPFPVGSRDAALVVDLPAGSYTAVISGDTGTTGEIILEVYRVP